MSSTNQAKMPSVDAPLDKDYACASGVIAHYAKSCSVVNGLEASLMSKPILDRIQSGKWTVERTPYSSASGTDVSRRDW
jgi:hypothetical protein